MDSAVLSAYENVSDIKECSESVLYQAVNNVLSVTTINGNKIFCPLCVNTFKFKFQIQDHMKNVHYHFLHRTMGKSFIYEQCPFCYANFFGKHTVVNHSLQIHSKLIAQLYLQTEIDSVSGLSKCYFCCGLYRKKSALEFASHVQKKHFLQLAELFDEQFMKENESILTPKAETTDDEPKLITQDLSAITKVSQTNNFDFSSLEKQLCHIESGNADLKSILKSNRTKEDVHSPTRKARVCRVLQFDLPEENKENSVLIHNIQSHKQLTLAEHRLLCSSKSKEFKDATICLSNAGIQPVHCSTPKNNLCNNNTNTPDKMVKSLRRKLKMKKKATFKSYFNEKDLVFQCGKCKKLFQENIELHSHIKKNHKLFILNLLHPCYQCAICEAKFFKNYYLKKHIILHTSCKEFLPK